MRTLLLIALISLAGPATAQDVSLAGQCSFEGTWRAQAGFTTRIDARRHWATWSGNSTEGSPAAEGWVLTDNELMTFDHAGAERGHPYVWSFENDCEVLDLRLVPRADHPDGYRLRFTRVH